MNIALTERGAALLAHREKRCPERDIALRQRHCSGVERDLALARVKREGGGGERH